MITAPDFEAALNRIQEIITELENGELPLTQCLERFREADALRKVCEKYLNEAEVTVRELSEGTFK